MEYYHLVASQALVVFSKLVMIILSEKIKSDIREYSKRFSNEECCGLIVKKSNELFFYPCKNISFHKSIHCILNPVDYIKAGSVGEIIAHVHSQGMKNPSPTDYVNAAAHNIYSIIYSWEHDFFSILDPSFSNFLNIDYCFGKNDCFTLVKNYYKKYLNIEIKDYYRAEDWYQKNPLYIEQVYSNEGFIKSNNLKLNDIIIFRFKNNSCHLSIYLGNGLILHHPRNEVSIISELTEGLNKRIYLILRHVNYEK